MSVGVGGGSTGGSSPSDTSAPWILPTRPAITPEVAQLDELMKSERIDARAIAMTNRVAGRLKLSMLRLPDLHPPNNPSPILPIHAGDRGHRRRISTVATAIRATIGRKPESVRHFDVKTFRLVGIAPHINDSGRGPQVITLLELLNILFKTSATFARFSVHASEWSTIPGGVSLVDRGNIESKCLNRPLISVLIHPRIVRRVRCRHVGRRARRGVVASAIARGAVIATPIARTGDVDGGRRRGHGTVSTLTARGEPEEERAGCGGAEEASGHGWCLPRSGTDHRYRTQQSPRSAIEPRKCGQPAVRIPGAPAASDPAAIPSRP